MRHRRTRAQVEQLERQILEVLLEDRPQSIRHLFYRMTNPRLPEPVEKTDHGYNQVQARLVSMRRDGIVPYRWISDSTRRGYHTSTYAGAGDFLERMHGLYRGDIWQDSQTHVEVWCESRSLAGVIQGECRRLAVSLYPCGGFASLTLVHEAADDINDLDKDRVVILYVGDFDPAGVLIDKAVERELRQCCRAVIEFRRLAINPQQIEEHDLPAKPRKETERRRMDITETVEAEAMPAAIMRRLVVDAVESYLPDGRLGAMKAVEEGERLGLSRLAGIINANGIDRVVDTLADV